MGPRAKSHERRPWRAWGHRSTVWQMLSQGRNRGVERGHQLGPDAKKAGEAFLRRASFELGFEG